MRRPIARRPARIALGPWVLALALAALIVGILLGDLDSDLLLKAKVICLECIGIG